MYEITIDNFNGPMDLLLHLIKEIFSNKLICVHINHNLREESASELEFVKKYCFDNSIASFIATILGVSV